MNMELDKFAVLHDEIQKGIADLEAGKVRSGKQILDDLAFSAVAKKDLAEVQEGKAAPLD